MRQAGAMSPALAWVMGNILTSARFCVRWPTFRLLIKTKKATSLGLEGEVSS